MPYSGESIEIRRIESEKGWIFGGFNDKGVLEFYHGLFVLTLQAGSLQNCVARSGWDFFRAMVVNSDQSVQACLPIVAYRSLFFNELEAILLQ